MRQNFNRDREQELQEILSLAYVTDGIYDAMWGASNKIIFDGCIGGE